MRNLSVLVLALCAACGGASSSGDDDVAIDAHPGAIDADPAAPDGAAPDGGDVGPTDPTATGVWAVNVVDGTATTSLGTASTTVYSPSSDGGATPAAGPFPLVIVSTGYQIGRGNYDETCRHVASWGYVVVSHDYTSGNHQEKAAEIGDLIDWELAHLGARIDATRIAVAGHSMGGKVSINAAILDARIKAVVGWDPVDALPPFPDGSTSVAPELMDGLTVPMAVLGETGDTSCAPSADNFTQFFAAACAAPAALQVTIANADHTDWVDDRGSCGVACLFCATGTTPDATTLDLTRGVTVAWLETYLRGRTGFAAYLAAPGSPANVVATVPGC